MNELEDLLHRIFGSERIKYYNPADAIRKDHFVRWNYLKNQRNLIVISIGSNDGEVTVNVFSDPKKLEAFLNLVFY